MAELNRDQLQAKADELAGRNVEVSETTDGKFAVLWLNFNSPPPPKADTPEEALQAFIDMLKNQAPADTMASEDTAPTNNFSQDQDTQSGETHEN